MNREEVGKGVNGPMKPTGTNSTSIVKTEAWIFLTSGLSPVDTGWVRGLVNKSEMETFRTVVPCREFTFNTTHRRRVRLCCVLLVYILLFQFTSHSGSRFSKIFFQNVYQRCHSFWVYCIFSPRRNWKGNSISLINVCITNRVAITGGVSAIFWYSLSPGFTDKA